MKKLHFSASWKGWISKEIVSFDNNVYGHGNKSFKVSVLLNVILKCKVCSVLLTC